MEGQKSAYETLRIDLLPGAAARPPAPPPAPAARLTRAHWTRPSRLMESVVRSRYQELLQSVYDAAFITDLSGVIVDANVRAEEFFQLEQERLLNRPILAFVEGADEGLLQALNEHLKTQRYTLIQAFCRRGDGSAFPAEIAVSKLRLDQIRLCFFVRDITRRIQTEELLRKEHTALEHAGCGLALADTALKIEYANPAFARLVGAEAPAALVGRDLREWFAEAGAAEALREAALAQADPVRQEAELRGAGGGARRAAVTAVCCRDSDGEPLGLVFSFETAATQPQP